MVKVTWITLSTANFRQAVTTIELPVLDYNQHGILIVLIFVAESCSLTQTEDNPWWRLDLGYVTAIRELYIAAPRNGTELKDFEIRIGNSTENKGNDTDKCGDKHSVRPGDIKTISCNITGQYINIRVPENGKALSLCEVVPYGMGE